MRNGGILAAMALAATLAAGASAQDVVVIRRPIAPPNPTPRATSSPQAKTCDGLKSETFVYGNSVEAGRVSWTGTTLAQRVARAQAMCNQALPAVNGCSYNDRRFTGEGVLYTLTTVELRSTPGASHLYGALCKVG